MSNGAKEDDVNPFTLPAKAGVTAAFCCHVILCKLTKLTSSHPVRGGKITRSMPVCHLRKRREATCELGAKGCDV